MRAQCPHGVDPGGQCRLCPPRRRFPWGLFAGAAVLVLVAIYLAFDLLNKNGNNLAWIVLIWGGILLFGAANGAAIDRKRELAAWRESITPCEHGIPAAKRHPELCATCTASIESKRVEAERLEAERQSEFIRRVNNLEALRAMEPMEFQRFIWFVYRRLGFEVTETPAGRDGGVDGFLERDGKRFILQCKRYRGDVGEPVLHELLGTTVHHGAHGAVLVTTGAITKQARAFCSGKKIELVDYVALTRLIEAAELSELGNPESLSSPMKCPHCRRPLRLWRMRKGSTEKALVCTGFPGQCSYTRSERGG